MINSNTPLRPGRLSRLTNGYRESPQSSKNISSILNTAFKRSSSALNSNSPAPITPRIRVKSATQNACYTPSSLFRDNHLNKCRTPARIPKECAENNESKSRIADANNLTVAVRIRPLLSEQECTAISEPSVVINISDDHEIVVRSGYTVDGTGILHSFKYDKVYSSMYSTKSGDYATQKDVYDGTARNLLDQAFEGYNACLFAYGQTGSGKSYTMIGNDQMENMNPNSISLGPEAGITPRFCQELFERIDKLKSKEKDTVKAEIEISYFEIYNEKIYDLLCTNNISDLTATGMADAQQQQRPALKVREHPIWGPYVVNLSVHPVTSLLALQHWLIVGQSHRATAATGMNTKSSRSHSILNIMLTLTNNVDIDDDDDDHGGGKSKKTHTRRSKISLVDLAGSERLNNSGDTNGYRIKEGVCINKSLLTLGKVIAALADNRCHQNGASSSFVPYRESVLTWLLRESLGGNSKTVMLATISPSSLHVDETLATLRYACQARNIVNRARINESPHDKLIRELRAEVERLKLLQNEYLHQRCKLPQIQSSIANVECIISQEQQTNNCKITATPVNDEESVQEQLTECENELINAEKSWLERVQAAENQRQLEIRLLRRKGLAFELSTTEQKQICLVNLTEDPVLSGTLFYLIPKGRVSIGRLTSAQVDHNLDILLDGSLVANNHCLIENINMELYIQQQDENFETYLNGELLVKRARMFHGDRLIIGGIHYFRISNPFCSKTTKSEVVDFRKAHQEILQKQEEKIRLELEIEKKAALQLIENERMENERTFRERIQQFELENLKLTCSREILQSEQHAFKNQIKLEENGKCMMRSTGILATSAQKSNLLENIKSIMQHPSEESLHKTQVMVKEATQMCRDHGLQLEFQQSQLLDDFGMCRTVVRIMDEANHRQAEWPSARLGVWLEMTRDNIQNLNLNNLFNSVDINWEPLVGETGLPKTSSPSTNRISVNFNKIRGSLLHGRRSVKPLSVANNNYNNVPCKTIAINNACPTSTSLLAEAKLKIHCKQYINDVRFRTDKLRNFLIENDEYHKNSKEMTVIKKTVARSLSELERLLDGMQSSLTTASDVS